MARGDVNLQISLSATVDIDLKLYVGFDGADADDPHCIAGYDCDHPTESTFVYNVNLPLFSFQLTPLCVCVCVFQNHQWVSFY